MPASAISATGVATFALLTADTLEAAQRVSDLDTRTAPANYKAQLGTFLREMADTITVLDAAYAAQLGTPSNWAAPVADIPALKAIALVNVADKQARVVESNGVGGESVYIYDADSTADAEEPNIIVPTDPTGRWILAMQGGLRSLPVVGDEAGGIPKGTACYISGWDATTKRLKVKKADSTDRTKQAVGIAPASIANTVSSYLALGEASIVTSGLATNGGAAVGDPVYYTAAGAPTLTPPATPFQQVVMRVATLAASGTLRVTMEDVRPAPAATTTVAGLQSAADKTKQNNTLLFFNGALSALDMAGGGGPVTKYRAMGFAPAAGTVTAIKWLSEGAASVAPAANPNDLVVEVYKGVTLIGNKTYVAAVPPNAWDALTLSVVPGALTLAAADAISIKIVQGGNCDMDTSAVFQVVVSPAAA